MRNYCVSCDQLITLDFATWAKCERDILKIEGNMIPVRFEFDPSFKQRNMLVRRVKLKEKMYLWALRDKAEGQNQIQTNMGRLG